MGGPPSTVRGHYVCIVQRNTYYSHQASYIEGASNDSNKKQMCQNPLYSGAHARLTEGVRAVGVGRRRLFGVQCVGEARGVVGAPVGVVA